MGRKKIEDNYFVSRQSRGSDKNRFLVSIKDDSYSYGYKRIVIHAENKTQANKIARTVYQDYVERQEEVGAMMPKTVGTACKLFIERRAMGRRETCQNHSITQVTSRYRNYFIPFLGKKLLEDLTVEDAYAYKKFLIEKDFADKTIGYFIAEAKEFFNYCVEVGWMDRTPFDSTFKMARPKPKKIRVPGNLDDYQAMLKKPWKNPVQQAAAMLCFFTGMRVSEIRAIHKGDFRKYYGKKDIEDCVVVHIRRSLDDHNNEKSPKNGRERLTVIPRWVYEFIRPVMDLSLTELAFSNTQGARPFSIDKNLDHFRAELGSVTGRTAEEVRAAGIDFHSMRAMFNSMMTGELSDDIRRSILGWTSENVGLQHYFKVLPAHYQKILDAQKDLFSDEDAEWFKEQDIIVMSATYRNSNRKETVK